MRFDAASVACLLAFVFLVWVWVKAAVAAFGG
jgi:hypothetical protein